MDRDEVGTISKKRKIEGDTPNLEAEGSSKVIETQSVASKFVYNVVYRLYFTGLVSKEYVPGHGRRKKSVAGFGVAICDETDKLLFEIKEPVRYAKIKLDEVEIRALVRGLSESFDLGIRKVVIYCEDDKLYQKLENITTGKRKPRQRKVVKQLMEEVQSLRKKFTSSEAILVAEKDIKFACKLAREAIVSQTSSIYRDEEQVYDCSSGGDTDGDNHDHEDDNPWAYGCGCAHWTVGDHPPSDGTFFDEDAYREYYTL